MQKPRQEVHVRRAKGRNFQAFKVRQDVYAVRERSPAPPEESIYPCSLSHLARAIGAQQLSTSTVLAGWSELTRVDAFSNGYVR